MKAFLAANKGALTMFGLSIAFIAASVGISGCQLDKLIKVDVPTKVQAAVESPEQVPLAESQVLWDEWAAYVKTNSDALKARISDAQGQYATVTSLTSMGLEAATGAASTLPGGALIVAGLTGLGGLFLKRPGTDRKMQEEKQASYNKGFEIGRLKNEQGQD